jgi:peroxiredoxin
MTQMQLSYKLFNSASLPGEQKSEGTAVNLNNLLAGGLLAIGTLTSFALTRPRPDELVSASKLIAAHIGQDQVTYQLGQTLAAPAEPRRHSPDAGDERNKEETRIEPTVAKVSFVSAETDTPSIFRNIAHTIGKRLPLTPLEATGRPLKSGAPREVKVGKVHADSIVCLLPGMIDARLKSQDGMWRAGWNQITEGTSCQSEMMLLAKHFDQIRANGLSLAVVSGQMIPSPAEMKSGVDILWDQDGSFLRALRLEPLRYRDTEFHPRVTLLVREGEIIAGFSETKDFGASLRKLLALANESNEPSSESNPPDTKNVERPLESAPIEQKAPSSPPEDPIQRNDTTKSPPPKEDAHASPGPDAPAKDKIKPESAQSSTEKPVESPKAVTPPVEKPLTAFMAPSPLIGKEILTAPIFKAVRNNDGTWSRNEVLASQALKYSVITFVPGPIDWSMVTNGENYRATWEAIPGASTYPAELKILEENAEVLRRKGLEPVLMTGAEDLFSLSKVAQEHPTLSAMSDYRGSFVKTLGISPFTVWTKEFHPRVTLLVRDGKVERAFSETADFRASLMEMLSNVPDKVQVAPIQPERIPSPPPSLEIPIIARTFDITALHFDHFVQDVPLGRGRTLLFKKEPYYASSYAFFKIVSGGLEKLRRDTGDLPKGCALQLSIHDGHRSFSCVFDPTTIPASREITPSTFAQFMARNPNLFGTLERLADQSGRMGLRMATSNTAGGGTDFKFSHPMRGHSASIDLKIIGR